MAANCYAKKIENLGVGVHCSTATNRIVKGKKQLHRMEFADGEHLETDMIIFSAGIRPQDELARQSGLEIAVNAAALSLTTSVRRLTPIFMLSVNVLFGTTVFLVL